jgi:hypothetical protein
MLGRCRHFDEVVWKIAVRGWALAWVEIGSASRDWSEVG